MAWNPLVKKIEKARFVALNFTGDRMAAIALPVVKSVQDRIYAGLNASDQPAKPLKPGYAKQKVRKHRRPVRDLTLTGTMMRAMAVLSATNGQAVIGFLDARSNQKAYVNNSIELQFAMSPRNDAEFLKQVQSRPIIGTRRGDASD
jgi:hypothetical protein